MPEIQEDKQDVSTDDIAQAWGQESENTQDQQPETESEVHTEVEHNEAEAQEEPVVSHSAEPIILRKKNKRLAQRNADLERMLAERGHNDLYSPNHEPSQPQPLVDFMTGEPVDEDSVQGQVQKALLGIAAQQKRQQEQTMQVQAKAQADAMLRNFIDDLQSAGNEKYPDFDEVVFEADGITPAMRDAALMLTNPEDVFYNIAKNPKELKRISNLPPLEQAREMVKVSGTLIKEGTKPKVTSTSKPMTALKNNPSRQPSREITEKSSIAEIRERMKKAWR